MVHNIKRFLSLKASPSDVSQEGHLAKLNLEIVRAHTLILNAFRHWQCNHIYTLLLLVQLRKFSRLSVGYSDHEVTEITPSRPNLSPTREDRVSVYLCPQCKMRNQLRRAELVLEQTSPKQTPTLAFP